MGRFLRLSDEELARLLAGEAAVADEAYEEVVSLLTEARSAFSAAPEAATRALHIATISEASHALADNGSPVQRPVDQAHRAEAHRSGQETWRRVISMTKSLLLRAGAATVAASMSMVGIAYAGVDLPGAAAEKALEAVLGIELPNQDAETGIQEESVADADETGSPADAASDIAKSLNAYISTTEDTGCVFGQNVAAIASGADPTSGDPCTEGSEREEAATENSAEGRSTAHEKSAGGRAAGEAAAEEGQSNAPVPGSDTDADDDDSDGNPTGKGQGSGDEAAEEGKSKNPTEKP